MAEAKATPSSKSPNRLTGLKKRQQIALAGRTMFVWVAIAAVSLSFFAATGQYLFDRWLYNNKIIGAKYEALGTLNENIESAQLLKQEVDGLVADQNLASVKTNEDDSNTKSVLDALPTTLDPSALATSLQEVVLSRSGVTIDSISVPPDTEIDEDDEDGESEESGPLEMSFSFVVLGSYDKIETLIRDLERTIRPIKVTSVVLNGSDTNLRATFEAVTYYQPAKTVDIQTEVIR